MIVYNNEEKLLSMNDSMVMSWLDSHKVYKTEKMVTYVSNLLLVGCGAIAQIKGDQMKCSECGCDMRSESRHGFYIYVCLNSNCNHTL